jgi:hypothetical protein
MLTKALHAEPEFTLDASSLANDEGTLRRPLVTKGRTGPKVAALSALALLFAAGAIYYYWPRTVSLTHQTVPTPPAANPAPAAEPKPAIKHPVDKIPVPSGTDSGRTQPALPALDNSDIVAKDAIEAILNGSAYIRLLTPNGIIRHIVATIDNLPRKTMAARIRPVMPVPGTFATTNSAHGMLIADSNAGRYAAYVHAAESIDSKRLVQLYVRLYPLFQQAYGELGYPDGFFNDRLIGVIDHLLAAPEPKSPVRLSQPRIMFAFDDPSLEDLSAGQKILVRIGIDNERRLKAKLRDVRKALTGKAVNP